MDEVQSVVNGETHDHNVYVTNRVQMVNVERSYNGIHILDQTIYQRNFVVESTLDTLEPGQYQDPTDWLCFRNCHIVQFPSSSSILNIVPFISFLEISNCGLMKICALDLQHLTNLVSLNVQANNLEYLPGMFFYDPAG